MPLDSWGSWSLEKEALLVFKSLIIVIEGPIPATTSGQVREESKANVGSQQVGATEKDKDKTTYSLQSQLTSSLLETSEDEEAKKKEAEK